ncbi:ABC transporter permease subunit [Irregularibacter muris]|uniref:ABC transporter permease subunit n=1 Tax=Irregularibacter muris TaxID=1796619 RepID=A0AAE3HEF2_9FIRM|nr:glycine betaine ABC transporter substrate-binding protein [Irregularibacter muris]MCR1898960.1 ABC transporter permease subunit [Irregularibacter muris]
MMAFLSYFINNIQQVISLTTEHIILTAIAVGLAVLIGVPLGIFISYFQKASRAVVGATNIVQAIPSMALLGLIIPLLGIGSVPSVVIVILYSLLPIVKNTYTGITSINEDTLESAKAIGLTRSQVLIKVQIPLALPVIMAGVRISAVTAVGLMTMAAFIGAGGLGFLIFSGISTVNTHQILAGAIPACILALLVDFIFGLIEKLVTPISLQNTKGVSKKALYKTRKNQKGILALTAIILIAIMISTGLGNINTADKVITIGGKDFTEQRIATELMAELIEDRSDIKVNRRSGLGGTQVCFNALKSGDIDMYLEYTGTAYGDTLSYPPITDMDEVYDTVKKDFKEKFDLEVLEQMNFNNTYTLAVSQEIAGKYNLETISDLAKVGNQLTVGSTLEFLNREDGIVGLAKHYGFSFKNEIGINGSNRYIAIENKEIDVTNAFSTDGLLKKFNLQVLKDDQNFFPPYYAIPIIRSQTLKEYPEIQSILAELGEVLTDEVMMELNYQVDELQQKPKNVAHDFLEEQGMLKNQ